MADILNADKAALIVQTRFTAFLKDFERPQPPASQSEAAPSSARPPTQSTSFKVRASACV
jgi:hypothetical protein